MPMITGRGALCARAFGFAGKKRTLVTATYTSSGTWTCPAGITSINVTGQGADGLSDYAQTDTKYFDAGRDGGVNSTNPFANWSTLYADYQAALAQLTSLPAFGSSVQIVRSIITVSSNDKYTYAGPETLDMSAIWITGATGYSNVLTVLSSPGSHVNTGNITYAGLAAGVPGEGFAIVVDTIEHGHAGASATGFGQMFPGGAYVGSYPIAAGYGAAATGPISISVTPTTGYPIVIPAGGTAFVTISYYI